MNTLGLVYEKHVEGLCWRLGADVICCNSAADVELFQRVALDLGLDPSPIVRAGAAVVQSAKARGTHEITWPPRRLVFAVQPDVPRRRDDRQYLLERMVEA